MDELAQNSHGFILVKNVVFYDFPFQIGLEMNLEARSLFLGFYLIVAESREIIFIVCEDGQMSFKITFGRFDCFSLWHAQNTKRVLLYLGDFVFSGK